VVYEFDIRQPSANVSTDIIFGVASTNCTIGGLSGAAGYPTSTTAFQSGHLVNGWGFVCWLTNRPGVSQPEIEFRYLSGTSSRTYLDCIRFSLRMCPAITSFDFAGGHGTLRGTGGLGKTFILVQRTNFASPTSSWTPVATNDDGTGAFSFDVEPGAVPSGFFRVQAR